MLNQLDLSRVTLSRTIAREQHWIVRVLLWLVWLVPWGYFLCIGGWFASGFGRFLKPITEPVVQEHLLAGVLAVVFVALFGLVSYFYHRVLYEAPELPQLLTMPLTTRQIFLRLLPRILEGTGLALPLALVLWGAFAVGFSGWRWSLLATVPVLTVLTGIVSWSISLCIVMYIYQPYTNTAGITALSGGTMVAVTSLQMFFYHNQSATVAWWDAVLRTPPIHALIEICPGAWLAHWLMAATHDTGTAIGWMALILVASLSGAALVARKVFVGYTQDAILEEHERGWTVVEKKMTSKTRKSPTALRWLDEIYMRWFTQHQRGILSLTFQDVFEGDLARRTLGMVIIGMVYFFITVLAREFLPLLLAPKEVEAATGFILLATAFGVFLGAMFAWFPGGMTGARQSGLRRGSHEVPLLEIVPFDPREYLSTCFHFLASLSIITWLCLLPAFFALPIPDLSGATCVAVCAGILACLLEAAFVVPIARAESVRPRERTAWAEVSFRFKRLAILTLSVPAAAGAAVVGGWMLTLLGLSGPVSFALSAVVIVCIADYILYHAWLYMWREHNYDAEGQDSGVMVPSWFRGQAGG